MSERGGGGEFFAGFLIGAIVGGVAALLLAPQSGEETRQRLEESGIELKERGRIALEEQKAKLEQAIEEGKEAAAKKREDLLGKPKGEEAAA